jgi:hypothetical protein
MKFFTLPLMILISLSSFFISCSKDDLVSDENKPQLITNYNYVSEETQLLNLINQYRNQSRQEYFGDCESYLIQISRA